jgi:hypothetical protein
VYDKGKVPEAVGRLVQLYEVWDRPDDAAKWRAERDRYPDSPTPTK